MTDAKCKGCRFTERRGSWIDPDCPVHGEPEPTRRKRREVLDRLLRIAPIVGTRDVKLTGLDERELGNLNVVLTWIEREMDDLRRKERTARRQPWRR